MALFLVSPLGRLLGIGSNCTTSLDINNEHKYRFASLYYRNSLPDSRYRYSNEIERFVITRRLDYFLNSINVIKIVNLISVLIYNMCRWFDIKFVTTFS